MEPNSKETNDGFKIDYYKWFKDGKGNRDPIFKEVLSLFNKQPIDILEIGTMRSIDERSSGGASTFFWAEYIKNYGGELHICDTSQDALNFSYNALKGFFDYAMFYKDTGLNFIRNFSPKKWDLVLLDGSDDPKEMLEEFKAVNAKAILCDDFYTKGAYLREKYPNFKLYKWKNCSHEMALYGVNQVVFMEPIV